MDVVTSFEVTLLDVGANGVVVIAAGERADDCGEVAGVEVQL